jgi:hypothetical protein
MLMQNLLLPQCGFVQKRTGTEQRRDWNEGDGSVNQRRPRFPSRAANVSRSGFGKPRLATVLDDATAPVAGLSFHRASLGRHVFKTTALNHWATLPCFEDATLFVLTVMLSHPQFED